MTFFYDFIFLIYTLVSLPYLLTKRKLHPDFGMRFGSFSDDALKRIGQKQNIWIHAVSVGEVILVNGLITALKKRYPQYQIVLSTVTSTGYNMASTRSAADVVIYAPLDLRLVAQKYIQYINPKIYIVAETEIWPNLFTALKKSNIPIVLINGRLSDKSSGRYLKFRFFLKPVFDLVDIFCMQSVQDAGRVQALGIAKEKILTVGNIKFDDVPDQTISKSQSIPLKEDNVLWVAGSTHAGEEEIILKIYSDLKKDFPGLRLILAPRHIERAEEVKKLIDQNGFSAVKLSQKPIHLFSAQSVILVDTIGDLRFLYSLAKIVFVGKSLTVGGGHNIIEPAFFAKPVLIGPLMQNFRDVVNIFLQKDAVIQVSDARELEERMRFLLSHPEEMTRLGQAAKNVILENRGATEKTLSVLSRWLDG